MNITKPLKKLIVLKQEDDEDIPLPVVYERLPDFCFCCGCIGHQFRECMEYKGQQKENLPFGPWLKAVSLADRIKLNRAKEKWSRKHEKSREEVPESDSAEIPNPGSPNLTMGQNFGSTLNKESTEREGGLIRVGHVEKGVVTADNLEGSKKKLMQPNDKKLKGAAEILDVTGMQDIKARLLLEKENLEGNGKGKEILAGK